MSLDRMATTLTPEKMVMYTGAHRGASSVPAEESLCEWRAETPAPQMMIEVILCEK